MRLAIVFLFLCKTALYAQSTCKVWQWTGTDSANKTIARTDLLNEHGLTIRSAWTGYQMYPYSIPDQVSFTKYRDTLQTMWICATPEGDSMRIDFSYNENGQP